MTTLQPRRYRSKTVVEAAQVPSSDGEGETFEVESPYGELTAGPGDYIVRHSDGTLDIWSAEKFEKAFELVVSSTSRRIVLEPGGATA